MLFYSNMNIILRVSLNSSKTVMSGTDAVPVLLARNLVQYSTIGSNVDVQAQKGLQNYGIFVLRCFA
jgi:hypothetical protein